LDVGISVGRDKVIDDGRQPAETGLIQDPHRLVKNLTADPKHADRLNPLRVGLEAWMKAPAGRRVEDGASAAGPAA